MNTEFEESWYDLRDTLRENPEYSKRILACLKEFFNQNYVNGGEYAIEQIESGLRDDTSSR